MSVFIIRYDCDCVGENYSNMGGCFFKTEAEADRYIREELVDNRQGQGYSYDDFSIDELELQTIDMKRKEKRNGHFRSQFS